MTFRDAVSFQIFFLFSLLCRIMESLWFFVIDLKTEGYVTSTI